MRDLKGRRLAAFGDAAGIECAFGIDAVGAVIADNPNLRPIARNDQPAAR